MYPNLLRCLALAGLFLLNGYYAMKDDEVAAATEEKASMVERTAENVCAGQIVRSAGRLRCAGPDASGEMVATLIEVPQ